MIQKLEANSNYFWKYINSKRSCRDLPTSMLLEDVMLNDGQLIVDSFWDFFQSI